MRLAGQRIVVTRAVDQAEELARPLRELGAEVVLLPTIAIIAAADSAPLREAAAQCDSYDWIIFSSANAVLFFAAELPVPRGSCRARIATVGAATRQVAEKEGFSVTLTPDKYVAESLVTAFKEEDLSGRRVLIPSAAVTRDVLPNEFRKLNATVEVVEAYRNVPPPDLAARAASIFREPYPDWATFTSSSAFENLLGVVDGESLRRVRIATIGPITSETVRNNGFIVTAEANPHAVEGLVEGICGWSKV
jgi:uroporphyrinogen III methyltransferase/synthase